MTDTTPDKLDRVKDRLSTLTIAHLIAVLVVCSALSMGVVIAQTGSNEWSDTFQDGDIDGWTSENPSAQTDENSLAGDHSLYIETGTGGVETAGVSWDEGPVLDLSDDFTVEGTIRYEQPSPSGSTERDVRFGIISDIDAEGGNAILKFNENTGRTYLATYWGEFPDEYIENDFESQWVNFELESNAEDETLNATIWQAGAERPAEPQLSREFEGVSGRFTMNPGSATADMRHIWLDDVQISGTEAEDPNLELDAPTLVKHGESGRYSVDYTTPDNRTIDVTSEATVESQNEGALTVDEDNNQLVATNDTEFNDRVNVSAEYNGSVTYAEVAVAEVALENADILPTMFRFTALINNGNFFFILLATLAGVVGTRWSTSFGGLSFFEIVILIGWFGGWVQGGLMLVSVFLAGFIGLNLAANIDYTVRR